MFGIRKSREPDEANSAIEGGEQEHTYFDRRVRLRFSQQFVRLALGEIGPREYLHASAVQHPERHESAAVSSVPLNEPLDQAAVDRQARAQALISQIDAALSRDRRSRKLTGGAVVILLVAAMSTSVGRQLLATVFF